MTTSPSPWAQMVTEINFSCNPVGGPTVEKIVDIMSIVQQCLGDEDMMTDTTDI